MKKVMFICKKKEIQKKNMPQNKSISIKKNCFRICVNFCAFRFENIEKKKKGIHILIILQM